MDLNANDRAIAGFTMTAHALVHWFETAIPIFLVVWLTTFDVSVALVGVIVAIGYAPFGLGALPAGVVADRYGSRRVILFCLAGMSGAFLVLSLADSIWTVGVGLILWGIAASLYHPAGLSLISTGVSSRGTVFAWHGIAGNLGLALGPFTAAVLLINFSWSAVAAALALPGLVAVVIGLRARFDPVAAVERENQVTEARPGSLPAFFTHSRALFASSFAIVFVIVTFEGLFYRGMLTFLPEIMHDVPALADVGAGEGLAGIQPSDFIYVGLLVVGMIGQYAGGKATDRFPPEIGLIGLFLGLAALAVVFVPIAGQGVGPLIFWAAAVGFLLFAIQPFYQEAVAVHTPPDGRGLSYGYTYLGEFGLGAASVAIGGFLLGTFALPIFFLALASFALVGGTLAVVLWRSERRESDR